MECLIIPGAPVCVCAQSRAHYSHVCGVRVGIVERVIYIYTTTTTATATIGRYAVV